MKLLTIFLIIASLIGCTGIDEEEYKRRMVQYIDQIQKLQNELWEIKTDTNQLKRYLEDQRYIVNRDSLLRTVTALTRNATWYVRFDPDSTVATIYLPNKRPCDFSGQAIHIGK